VYLALYTVSPFALSYAKTCVLARHTIPPIAIPDKNFFITFRLFNLVSLYYFLNVRRYATMSFT
jgi:hypothetical protein